MFTHVSEEEENKVHQIISEKQTSDLSEDDELEAEDFAEDYRQKLLKYQEELQTINNTQHDLANILTQGLAENSNTESMSGLLCIETPTSVVNDDQLQ